MRHDLHAGRQDVLVQLVRPSRGCASSVASAFGALAQQHDAFDHVVVVDDRAVLAMDRLADLPEPDLRPLRHGRDIAHASGVPFCVLITVCAMSSTFRIRPTARTLICCRPCLDEAAAGVHVVVGQLLFHLADAQAVSNQLVRDRRAPGTRA